MTCRYYQVGLKEKTSFIQCSEVEVVSKVPLHFQIDGEFIGKTKKVEASINNRQIQIIVPFT